MSFIDNVRRDPSRVSDRRGRGRGAAIGGGVAHESGHHIQNLISLPSRDTFAASDLDAP
ncbi:neutral zinc metallopeptidase [Arthrobacter antioxidans]|uniref:neutral zinc metallopeptidase n=1 Tax=Arthrobacter antioxidans TaxID=2895818 RepID=UPI002000399A|nr:neutral zinc metallopeptidase [Arthrobacter antioxidans]